VLGESAGLASVDREDRLPSSHGAVYEKLSNSACSNLDRVFSIGVIIGASDVNDESKLHVSLSDTCDK